MKRNEDAELSALAAIAASSPTGHALARQIIGGNISVPQLRANSSLRKDEWVAVDTTVAQASAQRMVAVGYLIRAGMFLDIPNGLAKTVLETESISDMNDATLSMDGVTGDDDAVDYGLVGLPLPIAHKSFTIGTRRLGASRLSGMPLDTTQAGASSRKVAELIESMFFNGSGTFKSGGYNLYGCINHPSTNSVTMATHWDASAATGALILGDILNMKQASINDKRFGPWVVFVPTVYEHVLDDDFKAASDLTIRQRILQTDGIKDLLVADKLPADHVVMVELQPETARIVIGMQPTTLEWNLDPMLIHYRVMSIMVPQIRADQDGNCGVVVLHPA